MKPLILAFVSDLFFSTRVESVVQQLGYDLALIEREDEIEVLGEQPASDNPAEALQGRQGALIRMIIQRRPGLVIFDLNSDAIPWESWIARLKSAPATRRIPILAFGSHMDVATMTRAKECGADQVLARSRFTSEMPALIRKLIQIPDLAAIRQACQHPLSTLALEGIRLFNQGEYFEAHELLEDAWNEDSSLAKELYRAVLQVAVAYLQIERGNYRGALKMFLRVRQWLDPLPEVCRGVDVAQLRLDAAQVEKSLKAAGPEGIAHFDRSLFRPLVITPPSESA
jgi:predicted metal-dependent hydrolase